MRVLLVAAGSQGDVAPLLCLARAFGERGHGANVIGPPEWAHLAEDSVAYRPSETNLRELLEAPLSAALAGDRKLSVWGTVARQLRIAVASQFRELAPHVERSDVVIATGAEYAAATLAEFFGREYHFLVLTPTALPSPAHPPFPIAHWRLPTRLHKPAWRVFSAIHGRVFGPVINAERKRLGLARLRDLYAHQLGIAPWLCWDPVLAAVPAGTPAAARSIGALVGAMPQSLSRELEAFLERGAPPVYAGFGSMPDEDPAATTRAVMTAAAENAVRLVISRGRAGLGLEESHPDVLLVDDAPHALLFPRVAAVIHHGGAGTTAAAAIAGVPQLVVPHFGDQFWWALQVARLGVASRPLTRGKLRSERLAALLRECLSDPRIRARARSLGERLRANLPRDSTRRAALLEQALGPRPQAPAAPK